MEKSYVLVVDDNEATTTLITAVLHREFEVEVALDGTEAIERLRTKSYAAILLDLRMPQLDGFGVLDFLKEHQPQMLRRVLIVTAALTGPEMTRVEEYAVCGIVAKPFDVDTLLAAVKQCTGENDGQTSVWFSGGMILLLAPFLR